MLYTGQPICKLLVSYGKEDRIIGDPLQGISTLSAEDNCLQAEGSLVQNETIFLEFGLKFDDGALLRLKPGAKCPPAPLLASLTRCCV